MKKLVLTIVAIGLGLMLVTSVSAQEVMVNRSAKIYNGKLEFLSYELLNQKVVNSLDTDFNSPQQDKRQYLLLHGQVTAQSYGADTFNVASSFKLLQGKGLRNCLNRIDVPPRIRKKFKQVTWDRDVKISNGQPTKFDLLFEVDPTDNIVVYFGDIYLNNSEQVNIHKVSSKDGITADVKEVAHAD